MSKIFKQHFRLWWQAPRKADDTNVREVTFLELFYDLVYVVLIAEVAHHLATHLSWTGAGQFVFMFFFIIWAWMNGMIYHDLHGTNDISIRVFTFAQMILVGFMTIFVGDVFGDGADGFAISFAIFQLLFGLLWFRTGLFDPEHRQLSSPWSTLYFITAAAMLWSVSLEQPQQFYVWGGILAASMLSPIVARLPKSTRHVALRASNFTPSKIERFGLITIIVLGEVIVSAIRGAAEIEEFTLQTGLVLGLGLLIAIGLWWIYFDFISRRPLKGGFRNNEIYFYGHVPFMTAVAGAGAVLLYMLEHIDDGLSDQARWMFVGFVAVAVACVSLMIRAVKYSKRVASFLGASANIMLICAALIAALGFTNSDVVTLLGITFGILLIPVYYGVSSWLRTQTQ